MPYYQRDFCSHEVHSAVRKQWKWRCKKKVYVDISISKIKNLQGNTSERCGKILEGYDFYLWNKNDGFHKMGDWIEKAVKKTAG